MHYSPLSSSVRRLASYSDLLLLRHGRSQTTFWPTSRSSPETAVGRISDRCLLLLIVCAPLGTALAAIVPRAVEDAHGSGDLVEPQRAKCAPARQVRAPRGQVGGVGSSGGHDFGLKGCALLAAGKLSRTTGTRGSQYWSSPAEAFQRVDSGDRGASTLRRPPQWRALKIHFAHVAPVLRPKHKEFPFCWSFRSEGAQGGCFFRIFSYM